MTTTTTGIRPDELRDLALAAWTARREQVAAQQAEREAQRRDDEIRRLSARLFDYLGVEGQGEPIDWLPLPWSEGEQMPALRLDWGWLALGSRGGLMAATADALGFPHWHTPYTITTLYELGFVLALAAAEAGGA